MRSLYPFLGHLANRGRPVYDSALLAPQDLSIDKVGPFGCRVLFTPSSHKWRYIQVQRRILGGSYPTLLEASARGWGNFVPFPMKSRHFSDLLCNHGGVYEYQIRFVDFDPINNALVYGPWSEIQVDIPACNETILDLDNDYSGPYGDRLREAYEAARVIVAGDASAFVRIQTTVAEVDVEGEAGGGGHVLALDQNHTRISLEGVGGQQTVFNFKVLGGLDPEDNFLQNFNFYDLVADQALVQNREYHIDEHEVWRPTNIVGNAPADSADFPTGQGGASPFVDSVGNTWEFVWTPTAQQCGGRGSFFQPERYLSLTWLRWKNIAVKGGCRPTGYVWQYDLSGLRRGWDQKHKGFSMGFANDGADFWCFDDCEVTGWRGECIYSGTLNGGSCWIVDCDCGQCNSSAISMSADQVILGGTIKDFANSGNESVFTFEFGSSAKLQNCVMCDVEIVGKDFWLLPANNPILVNDPPSPEARHCLALFGQPDTGVMLDRLTLAKSTLSGLLQNSEQRNTCLMNCTLTDLVLSGNTGESYWKTSLSAKPSYQLAGGLDNLVMYKNTFERSVNVGSGLRGKSMIDLTSVFDLPMTGVLILGNSFSNLAVNSAPESLFFFNYDRSGSTPPLYIDCEIAHNTETLGAANTYWSKSRIEGTMAPMPWQHDNSWEQPETVPAIAQLVWPGGSLNYTMTVEASVLKGHTVDNPAGSHIHFRVEPWRFHDGQVITVFGSWTGNPLIFESPEYDSLPGSVDLSLADQTEWVKFQYNTNLQKLVYLEHG